MYLFHRSIIFLTVFISVASSHKVVTTTCDFESLLLFNDTTSQLGLSGAPIFYGYSGFNWSNVVAARRDVANIQPLSPNGDGFGVFQKNDSTSFLSITPYTRKIRPFSVFVGFLLILKGGLSPAIRGSLIITPSDSQNTVFSPPYTVCPFNVTRQLTPAELKALISADDLQPTIPGGGLIEQFLLLLGGTLFNRFGIGAANFSQCDLPSGWRNVEKLAFAKAPNSVPDLSLLTQVTGLATGNVLAGIDDFKYQNVTA